MKTLRTILLILTACLFLPSCDIACTCGQNVSPTQYDKVLILYSAGYNNLSGELRSDIEEICSGYVPDEMSPDALVVISHLAEGSVYTLYPEPVITRYYRKRGGEVVCDTLAVMPEESMLTSVTGMRSALQIVDDTFHARRYGMIYSSHATGWLPSGYYNNPHGWKPTGKGVRLPEGAVPYKGRELEEGEPEVKSIGQTLKGNLSYEMELDRFVDAIPVHLDYIIFDACLMGGVEIAYGLRKTCDKVGFSPAEILSGGMSYTTMGEHLLKKTDPDLKAVCEDFFNHYDTQTSADYRSATISLVDCSRMDGLAAVCAGLFEKYRTEISMLDAKKVQRYYRFDKKWFFDLQDILEQCGIDASESAALQQALDDCIEYKAATPSFLPTYSGFQIMKYCGLSSYLPSAGSPELDSFYKSLDWNTATAFVK